MRETGRRWSRGVAIATAALVLAPLGVLGPAPALAAPSAPVVPSNPLQAGPPPLARVIAHRGASGYRPEHTLAAYALAIEQCADYVEPDVVVTKDGHLVVRHENNLADTTDVAAHPELAHLKRRKKVSGHRSTGWFTEDLTLAQVRTLRARERLPELRPASAAYDGRFGVPTLDEVLDLVQRSRTCDGRPVGVAPETKHPTYFARLGLPLEGRLVAALRAHGWSRKTDPVLVQSFETTNLKALATLTDVPLLQLVGCTGAPYDLKAAGKKTTYADLRTKKGLTKVARYADEVGLCLDSMIPRDKRGRLTRPTTVVAKAHRVGLRVTGATFRRENQFLAREFRVGTDPAAVGDLASELDAFLDAGMDGFFTDNPDVGVQAVRAHG